MKKKIELVHVFDTPIHVYFYYFLILDRPCTTLSVNSQVWHFPHIYIHVCDFIKLSNNYIEIQYNTGDIQISTAGRRDLNLIPEIWKDQIKRRICEIIRIRCDGIYGPKKNDTTEEIVFTPIKPPDFTKSDVKDEKPVAVKPTPVWSSPAGESVLRVGYFRVRVQYPLTLTQFLSISILEGKLRPH